MTTYKLPPPLSLNQVYRVVNGRKIKSKKYREWQEEAARMLMLQRPEPFDCSSPIYISYGIPMVHWRTGRRVGTNTDIDNRVKCLADAIVEAGIIPDDSMKYVRGFWAQWHGNINDAQVRLGASWYDLF